MDDLSEKEQLEQFRAWWSEYGTYVIGGIVIGAGLLFGINHYQSTKLEAQLAASAAYEELAVEVDDGNLDAAEAIAAQIATDFPDTVYVGQAGFAMARLYMEKNRDQDAADALQGVLNSAASEELKHVARVRLARIYLYQDKPQEVVDMLADIDAAAFSAAYGEILGDAYAALGRIAEAEDAYQRVLLEAAASQGSVDQQLVQWKVLDLPAVTASAAGTEAAPAESVEDPETSAETEATE